VVTSILVGDSLTAEVSMLVSLADTGKEKLKTIKFKNTKQVKNNFD
jgi:hypothetical protein